MGGVHTFEDQIGNAIRNNLEVGDEVCVHFEDGTYMNRSVTDVNEIRSDSVDETEVLLGDAENMHVVICTRVSADDEDWRSSENWDVYAYQIGDIAEEATRDHADPDALYVVNDADMHVPDITFSEAIDQGADKQLNPPQEIYDEMEEVINVAEAIQGIMERVQQDEITLAEMEQQLDLLQVRHGGTLPVKP